MKSTANDTTTQVLVCGGGPTGLALALLLGRAGVDTVLVERRPGTSAHPKATVVNGRTMELLRLWGLEDAVEAVSLPREEFTAISWHTRLTGDELGAIELIDRDADAFMALLSRSPVMPALCPQDELEPILRDAAAAQSSVTLLFGRELTALEDEGDEVRAVVRDAATGEEQAIRCSWVAGCDGARGPVRDAAGIALDGPPALGDVVNVLFEADLAPYAQRRSVLYWIVNADVRGVVHALDGQRRWLFNAQPTEAGRTDWQAVVRQAIGDASAEVRVLDARPWTMQTRIARAYRVGRVLLAGDAAHQFPPTGGFGMNTGIQDAHNLAWKLAAVVEGWAPERLLDTYEAERRPIAAANAAQSEANATALAATGMSFDGDPLELAEIEADTDAGRRMRERFAAAIPGQREHFRFQGQELGFVYPAGALVAGDDGADAGPVSTIGEYHPDARPGARAPHAWLEREGRELSTLDLFDGRLTLFAAGDEGDRWTACARDLRARGLPAGAVVVGRDVTDVHGEVPELYGLRAGGAVLVRPDGHVAWRTREPVDDPGAHLADVLGRARLAPAPDSVLT